MESLKTLSTQELNDLILNIKSQLETREEEKIHTILLKNTQLLNKCFKIRVKPMGGMFPQMWRYYKVISVSANTEKTVSALQFEEYPTYWFIPFKVHEGFSFGSYEFDSIIVDTVNITAIAEALTEISLKEYNDAMLLYIDRLQKIEWPIHHYKWGNKKPEDPDWEVK